MAEEDPALMDPPTPEAAVHVRDYERFTKMMFRGAVVFFVVAFIVLLILK